MELEKLQVLTHENEYSFLLLTLTKMGLSTQQCTVLLPSGQG